MPLDSKVLSTTTDLSSTDIGDDWTCYPCTVALVVTVHLLYLYHWLTSGTRQQMLASYDRLVQRGEVYRLWLSLLSHPPKEKDDRDPHEVSIDTNQSAHHVSQRSPLEIDSGSPEAPSMTRSTPSSLREISLVDLVYEHLARVGRLLYKGHLSGFPLVLYNSHLLWSCRALEYGRSWRHFRLLVVTSTLAAFIELFLVHNYIHKYLRPSLRSRGSFGESSATELSHDIRVVHRFYWNVIRLRTGTLTACATAIMTIFGDTYSHTDIPLLPFLSLLTPNHHHSSVNPVIFRSPVLSYFMCCFLLSIVSKGIHIWGVFTGCLVGAAWSIFKLDFLADSYWGTSLIICLSLVNALSLYRRYPDWVPCVDHVTYPFPVRWGDSGGERLVLSTPELVVIEESIMDLPNDDEGGDDERARQDSAQAFPPLDDDAIYGGRLAGDDDSDDSDRSMSSSVNDDQQRLLLPNNSRDSRIRSRRTAQTVPS